MAEKTNITTNEKEIKPVETPKEDKKPVETKKETVKPVVEKKKDSKKETKITEVKKEDSKEDSKVSKDVPPSADEGSEGKEKKEESKEETQKKKKTEIIKVKDKAIANGYSLKISLKHSKFICRMIKRKTIPQAVLLLENVVKGKQPVKMTGLEVGHQKGKGISGARFPRNASNAIIKIIKQLGANATVNGIEEPVITIAMANQASAPFKKGGKKAKRAHVHLEAQEKTKLIPKKKRSNKGAKK